MDTALESLRSHISFVKHVNSTLTLTRVYVVLVRLVLLVLLLLLLQLLHPDVPRLVPGLAAGGQAGLGLVRRRGKTF